MTAQSPEPGASAPGAPASVGSREVGAGGPAPGATGSSPEVRLEEQQVLLTAEQLEQINNIAREMEERLEEIKEELWDRLSSVCGPLVETIDYIHYVSPYHAETYYAFDVYRYLVFAREEVDYLDFLRSDVIRRMSAEEIERRLRVFDEEKVRSVERVIETCNLEQKLVDFIPLLKEWDDVVLEKLKGMSLREFLSSWEDVLDELKENDYEDLADAIFEALDYNNRFKNALMEEMEKQARRLLGATDDEIDDLFMCLVEC